MLAGRTGASGAARLGTGASDPVGPRDGGGRPRPSSYLDMKIHLEKNLEDERQILLQQQKICRNRARKYFMESNRRKKAFEEKLKEQQEREYQIRERILQQRKQKFEEVTEKFQRAHIPLSQRRRARTVFQKPVPPLEEALKQIQESNLKSEVNTPLSHRPTINWRSIPACPAVSTPDPSFPGQLSASPAPLLAHHSQILPSYPVVSPASQTHNLPSVPSTLAKTFLPAPLLSSPVKYLPRPPAPVTSHFSSSFPRLPPPIPSGLPDHRPLPSQSSLIIPDTDPQNRLFYKTFTPKHVLPPQRSTPHTLMPSLIRRSLPAQLVVSPTPLEALPDLKPSSLPRHRPHHPVPPLSCITPLPDHSARLNAFQSVQKSIPAATLSNQPQAFVDRPRGSVPSHPPPCHSPSSSLPSSPSPSSSPSVVLSSSSSIPSSPSPSSSSSPLLPPSVPPLPSPSSPSSSSPSLPPTYLAFPSPESPLSSSFMISSSFPPMLHSTSISTSPSPFFPIHPFSPPHWGTKVEKRREESGVEKKGIEKKKLKDDNLKEL